MYAEPSMTLNTSESSKGIPLNSPILRAAAFVMLAMRGVSKHFCQFERSVAVRFVSTRSNQNPPVADADAAPRMG